MFELARHLQPISHPTPHPQLQFAGLSLDIASKGTENIIVEHPLCI